MTTYILHGGFKHGEKQENDAFFAETLRNTPSSARVLLVYFAQPPERIAQRREEDTAQFEKNKGGKELVFDVATENTFVEQVRAADVIYLCGGHTANILKTLRTFSDLGSLFANKIVAADSAGVNAVCAGFLSKSGGPGEGLGLIPIKVLCHYTEEKEDILDDLRLDLETIRLREYEFRVFTL